MCPSAHLCSFTLSILILLDLSTGDRGGLAAARMSIQHPAEDDHLYVSQRGQLASLSIVYLVLEDDKQSPYECTGGEIILKLDNTELLRYDAQPGRQTLDGIDVGVGKHTILLGQHGSDGTQCGAGASVSFRVVEARVQLLQPPWGAVSCHPFRYQPWVTVLPLLTPEGDSGEFHRCDANASMQAALLDSPARNGEGGALEPLGWSRADAASGIFRFTDLTICGSGLHVLRFTLHGCHLKPTGGVGDMDQGVAGVEDVGRGGWVEEVCSVNHLDVDVAVVDVEGELLQESQDVLKVARALATERLATIVAREVSPALRTRTHLCPCTRRDCIHRLPFTLEAAALSPWRLLTPVCAVVRECGSLPTNPLPGCTRYVSVSQC